MGLGASLPKVPYVCPLEFFPGCEEGAEGSKALRRIRAQAQELVLLSVLAP